MGHPHQGQGHVAGYLSGRTTPRPFPPPTPQLLPESVRPRERKGRWTWKGLDPPPGHA